jgi:hypothetical protein
MVKKSSNVLTTSKRLDVVESKIKGISNTMSNISKISESILSKIESMNTGSRVPEYEVADTPIAEQFVKSAKPEIYAMSHSGMDNRVIATNIEKPKINSKGCFEILTALIEQYPKKLTVSSPHVKKDGTIGKSYIMNMPRIDENFVLVNKEGTSKKQQVEEAKVFWKAVAFNSYTFTGKYWAKGSGSVFTTYIKQANETPFLEFLKKKGIHIPRKDHNDPNKKEESGD